MPDTNEIYKFMKANSLTDKDEKTFLNEYSNPQKAKEVYAFFKENSLTDKDENSFYDTYLKKKEPTPSVSSNIPLPSRLPKESSPVLTDLSFKGVSEALPKASKQVGGEFEIGESAQSKPSRGVKPIADKSLPNIKEAIDDAVNQYQSKYVFSTDAKDKIEKAYKNGDLVPIKNSKGESKLIRGTGVIESFANAVNKKFEEEATNSYLANAPKQEQIKFLNNKLKNQQEVESAPSGTAAKVSEFVGENAGMLAKGVTAGIGATALALPTGGSSFAQFLSMLPDMAYGGYSGALEKNYIGLKQSNPNISDDEAYEKAHKAALLGEVTGIATNAALAGSISQNILGKVPKPTVEVKGVMDGIINSAKHAIKSYPKVGGVSVAGSVVNDLASNAIGNKVEGDEIGKNALESAKQMAVMHFGLWGLTEPLKIPSYIRPQIENVVASAPREEVQAFYEDGENKGIFPEGTTQKVLSKLSEFDEQKAIVSKMPLAEEQKAAIVGKLLQRKKIEEENSELKKYGASFNDKIEANEKKIEELDAETNNIAKTKDFLKYEKDNLTGRPAKGTPEEISQPIELSIEEEPIITEGFKNRVFEKNVQIGEAPKDAHISEEGYNYRTLSNKEIEAIKESGSVLPREGKQKGGNENTKYWTKGNGENWYGDKESQETIRVRQDKFNENKPVKAEDLEIYNKETKQFEPLIKETKAEVVEQQPIKEEVNSEDRLKDVESTAKALGKSDNKAISNILDLLKVPIKALRRDSGESVKNPLTWYAIDADYLKPLETPKFPTFKFISDTRNGFVFLQDGVKYEVDSKATFEKIKLDAIKEYENKKNIQDNYYSLDAKNIFDIKNKDHFEKLKSYLINKIGKEKALDFLENAFGSSEFDENLTNDVFESGYGIEMVTDENNPYKEMGFDAIKFKEGGKRLIAMFYPNKIRLGKDIISEAYHKAKSDNSNPELVKAVEELLGKKEEVKVETPTIEKAKGFTAKEGNKVVDEKGEPLVVYHGTKEDFTEFDESKMGTTDEGWWGKGFYFHTDPNRGGYGDIVKSVNVDLKNPIDLPTNKSGEYLYDIIGDKAGLDKSFRDKSAMSIIKEIGSDNFTKLSKELGYDGVVVNYAEGTKEIVAFNKKQIKILKEKAEPKAETPKEEIKPTENKKQPTDEGLRRAEAKKVHARVAAMEAPVNDARQIALRYIADGGKLSEKAINEVAGTTKRARLNTGERELKSAEAKSRDYYQKEGESLDELAHRLWEKSDQEVSERDIKDALMEVVREHNTRLEAGKAYLEQYNPEYAEEKYYERLAEERAEEFDNELKDIEDWLKDEGEKTHPIEAEEEHINNLIKQYEAEFKAENQQPTTTSEGEVTEKTSSRTDGEEVKKQETVADQYEAIKDIKSKKAQENAKKELINNNFESIVSQLMLKNKIKRIC